MCGCKKNINSPKRVSNLRISGPRPVQGGLAAAPNPAEVRALNLQNSVSVGQSKRLDEQRLALEKRRRQAAQNKNMNGF